MLLACAQAFAQNISITGTVRTDSGEPLVGAAVLVGGTQRGATTDNQGRYNILAPANGTLTFSFIGYVSQEEAINGRTQIDAILPIDVETIENVIVVAFGTAKREAYTGAASVIKAEDIQRRQVSNISKALDGQVAGVQMTTSTGQPGVAGTIRVRGFTSINASNSPLYVVDGVPFDGDLSTINPNDIESMSVLKDAASSALYGARGANGVVMITTRRGRSGDAVVSIDAKWGANSRSVPEYDVLTNPGTYYEKFWEGIKNQYDAARANANLIPMLGYQVYSVPAGETLMVDGKLNPNATPGYAANNRYYLADDWTDAAYNNAMRQEYNASVSGATDKMNYFFSAGYLNDKGYVVNSYYDRITFRLKTDYQAKPWLKIGANAMYANSDQNYPTYTQTSSVNMFYLTRNIAPIYPLYVRNTDGSIRIDVRGQQVYDYGDSATGGIARPFMGQANPVSAQGLNKESHLMDMFSGRAFAEISFLKDFRLQIVAGTDVDNVRSQDMRNPFYGQYASSGGYIQVSQDRNAALSLDQMITWKHAYGKHNVDVLVGHTYYQRTLSDLSADRTYLYNPDIAEVDNAILDPHGFSSTDKYYNEGYLGRVNYDYNMKYFFSGSYRRDASSKFAPGNRWGNFWSASGSWLMSREDFLQNASSWLNMLKVKASYGVQGNDALLRNGVLSFYPYANQYDLVNNANEPALMRTYVGNRNISWETNYAFNTGVEFSLFNNRLDGMVDFYVRTTKDLLMYRPVAPSLGYESYPDNVGDMRNTGVEVTLNGTLISTRDFHWSINLNATHNKNKILRLPEESREAGIVNNPFKYTEGGSMYDFYLREWAGVKEDTGQSQWYVVNNDGTKTTTTSYQNGTLVMCGASAMPDLYGGFGTSLTYKGFDLAANFSYQIGGTGYDQAYAWLMHGGNSSNRGRNWHTDILNSWSAENPTSQIPKVMYGDSYTNGQSTRFLIGLDYLCLQNITLGYTFPESIANKLGLSNLRIYGVADNVALFSQREGFDPRQAFTGISGQNYSPIRVVSGGVSLKF